MKFRALIVLLSCFATASWAEIPAPPPLNNHPVVDAADVFTPEQEEALNQKLLQIQRASKHQVAVLTIPSLDGYDIRAYGLNAARTYKLGGLDADDGALITVAPTEHKVGIEVGDGLRRDFTDAEVSGIIRDMVPHFKENDYAGGVNDAVDTISALIVPLTPAQKLLKQREASEAAARSAAAWASFKDFLMNALGGAAVIGFFIAMWRIITGPARRARVAEQLRLRRIQIEEQRVLAAERARVAAEARRRQQEREAARRAALTPAQRAEEDRQAEIARLAAEKRAEEERVRAAASRAKARKSSNYSSGGYSGGGYSGGGSSGSSGSSDSFSGGGGSFSGGGGSGSW